MIRPPPRSTPAAPLFPCTTVVRSCVRAALTARTACRTIPQVFVGGHFIGGCTETFDAYRSGALQRLLKERGIAFDEGAALDPYGFFPAWLQSRQAVAQAAKEKRPAA